MISLRELFYLWVILLSYNTEAFSHPLRNSNSCRVFTAPLPTSFLRSMTNVMCLRGGQQKCLKNSSASIHVEERERIDSASENAGRPLLHSSIALIPFTALLHSVGKSYSRLLQQYPIGTKSMTACCIFAMSDLFAQSLEKDRNIDHDEVLYGLVFYRRQLWVCYTLAQLPTTGIVGFFEYYLQQIFNRHYKKRYSDKFFLGQRLLVYFLHLV
jgi:hypothetical protein